MISVNKVLVYIWKCTTFIPPTHTPTTKKKITICFCVLGWLQMLQNVIAKLSNKHNNYYMFIIYIYI